MRIRRGLSVVAFVDGLRERHPEFNRPVRGPQLRAVLEREGIRVLRAPIRRRAFVDGSDGIFVITLKNTLPAAQQTKVLLHEYGHARLHLTDVEVIARQLMPCCRGDIRELEADLFAALLWYGPKATPEHPAIAPLYAKLEAPRLVRKPPAQIPLPLSEPAPVYRWPRARKPKPKAAVWNTIWFPEGAGARQASHESLLFDWSDEGKPLGFFHTDLGWIKVYDRAVIDGRAVLLRCGDPRTEQRIFVVSSSDRRTYSFDDRESRGRSEKELRRQLGNAVRRGPRSATAASQRQESTR